MRVTGGVVAGLLFVLIVLVVFAPTIAGKLAPGVVESAAREQIKGSVKVGGASFSWSGPQVIGPVEVKDPTGATVATVNVNASIGLWAVLTKGVAGDLGTVTLGGKADLVRTPDGRTNLERALEPTPAALAAAGGKPTGTGAGPARLPLGLGATLDLTGLDVTYKEVDSAGKGVREAAITGLKGQAKLVGGTRAEVNFSGAVQGGAGAAAGALAIKASADGFADASGNLTPGKAKVKADVNAANLPVPLLDALANLGGVLGEALGPTLTLTINADGGVDGGAATINVASANLTADFALTAKDGRVTSQAPGSLKVVSTRFAASEAFNRRFPQLKEALAKGGIAVGQWPGIEAQVSGLSLPLPPPNGATPATALDWRGAGAKVVVKVTGIAGTLTPPAGAVAGGGAGSGSGTSGAVAAKPFVLAPGELTIDAADLAIGVTIKGATNATLDGQPAGALSIDARATELLDASGRLWALNAGAGAANTPAKLPARVTATLAAAGVSTVLLQPFLATGEVPPPLDLTSDLGPTLDVRARVETVASSSGNPDLQADVTVTSANVTLAAPLTLALPQRIAGRGDTVLTVKQAGPALRRILAKGAAPGQAAALEVSGPLAVEVKVTGLVVPLPFDPATAGATAVATVSGLSVRPTPAVGVTNAPGPVELTTFEARATLAPGKDPTLALNGRMAHQGKPFELTGNLALAGLPAAMRDQGATRFLPGLGKTAVNGRVTIAGLPASLAAFATPAPAAQGAAAAPDQAGTVHTAALIAALADELTGNALEVSVTFAGPEQGGGKQSADLLVKGAGVSLKAGADVTSAEARVRPVEGSVTLSAKAARRALEASGAARDQLASVNVDGPATIALTTEAVVVPLALPEAPAGAPAAAGALPVPRFDRTSTPLRATLAVREPLLVSGIPSGPGQVLKGGVRGFVATATIPAPMLSASGTNEPAELALDGEVLLDAGRPVATLSGRAKLVRKTGVLDATVRVTKVDTAALDGLLGKPGFASGALGESAEVTVAYRGGLLAPEAGSEAPLSAVIDVVSPRLRGAGLRVAQARDAAGEETIIVTGKDGGAAKLEWAVDPAWANQHLLTPKDERGNPLPPAMRLTAPVQATLDLTRVAVSKPTPDSVAGLGDGKGPLKPGVFALDVKAAVPTLAVEFLDNTPIRPGVHGTPPRPALLEGVALTVKTTPKNEIAVDLGLARVNGVSDPSGSAARAVATVRGFADTTTYTFSTSSKLNANADVDVTAPRLPAALVDGLLRMNGQLVKTLGDEIKVTVVARGFSQRAGTLAVDLFSVRKGSATPTAEVRLAGEVVDANFLGGLLELRPIDPAKPAGDRLRASLAEFNYDSSATLLAVFPMFSSVSKVAPVQASPAELGAPVTPTSPATPKPDDGTGPSAITSGGLRIPLTPERMDGLSGTIRVDVGAVRSTLATDLLGFLNAADFLGDTGVSRSFTQRIAPFDVVVTNGRAQYQGVKVPIQAFEFETEGWFDLVTKDYSVVVWVPTAAAAKGLGANVTKGLGSAIDFLTPDVLARATSLPVRLSSTGGKKATGIDGTLVQKRLMGAPGGAVKGIGGAVEGLLDGLGGLGGKKKDEKR